MLAGVLQAGEVEAQAFPIFNGTVNTCAGAFLDSGGEGASGYSNDENFTYTICPDSPNDAISLNFLTFNLSNAGAAPVDRMFIYDGNSTAAPTLGNYAGNALQGVTVSASPLNSTGCLTIVFESNNTGTGIFAASITCYTPCQRPTAVANMGVVAPARICMGEAVTFNSAASFAAPGFNIATRRWDFGDGTILNNAPINVSHTYAQAGAYIAQLYLIDNNGCASTNRVDLPVYVGTEPDFVGTGGDLLGCVGETLCLDAVVNPTTWNELPGGDLGNGVFLPDNVGSCFEAEVTFTQFAAGQTLTSVNDLLSICMNMEHSFIGDLVVNVISPTGQTVTLHQQGGGGTYLGEPVDVDGTPNAQGECYDYCFSPTATNGTWVDNAGGTLPAGTYESLNALNGLVGSGLNGTWTLQICDLWASDNGFVCDWNIDFNPALFPDLIEFTPIYGTDCDSSSWTGPNISSTSADCQGICITPPGPGNYPYTYTVTDDFGCTFDTTITVTVIPGPQVSAGPDASTCDDPVQLNASITGGGFPAPCTYELRLRDSFGDGWTAGSSITVIIDGVPQSWILADGSLTSVFLNVTNGSTIVLDYTAAILWNGEQGFRLFDSAGNSVYNSPNGPADGIAWSGTANCPGGAFVYSWSPTTGLSNPNIANPVATVAGTTVYCVTAYQVGHPDCPATDCMTITVDDTVDPGTNGTTTVCSTSPAFPLFPLLGGTPTAGGTWSAPGGGAHSGTFTPGTDAAGVYTYTVAGSGACGGAPASSTVTVVVNPIPDAGAGSTLTVCSTDPAQNLFTTLGGTPQAGGTWTDPAGAAFSGTFIPGSDDAGVYTYAVNGLAPCPSTSATVTVVINNPPNAGADAVLTVCTSEGPAPLLNAIGAAPGGTWSGPSTINGDSFVPGTNLAGAYTYTLAGTPPCLADAATVTVSLSAPPDPGSDGSVTLCGNAAPSSLFGALGGTPDVGGTWSGPSPVVGGLIDPANMSAGVYTYTVAGTAPCPDESATVTVTINTPPNAGTDGTITLCSSDAPASLFTQLGGTPDATGTWSGPSPVVGGMIDPATMAAGAYTYTVAGTAPCPDETATVIVTINTPPDPGTNGAVTLCSTDAPASLLTQLGGTPDVNGTWSGPSPVVGGLIDPANMSAGVYTYTVAGTAPCPDESATVTVTINTPPSAGTDGTITLCSTDAPASLFAQLGGTPEATGTWSGPSPVVGGMIDPATMAAGAYTYTVAGTAPCPDETATVIVTINTPPDPGTDGAITLCSTDAAASLLTQLGGTPDVTGTWSGPSPVVGGMIDPANMSAGVYTYTVAGTAPCPDESATVTVTINTPPSAGTDGTITLCSSDAPASLFTQLGGTPEATGTWSGPSPVVGGMIDPATMAAGAYTYTVAGTAPCPDETATVTVTINAPPDPGTDGAITLCSTDAAASLLTQLGGTPDVTGTWSGPSPVVGGMIDPANMSAGVYTYTVAGTAPCPDESATVTVTINTPPNAGTDGTITLCSSDAPASLFTQLGGTPDATGTWSGPSPVVGGMIDPATMAAGAYTYTVAGTAPCPDETATVTVTINAPPDPGTDASIALCATSPATSLFDVLGGTPEIGGSWAGPSALNGALFDPATMVAGDYVYTVQGDPPCTAASATVTVNVVINPDPGAPGAITLCTSAAAIDLFSEIAGTPDAGGIWTGASPIDNGQFDPSTMAAGVYTYTINVPAPCVSVSTTVTVSLVQPPDAGNDGSLTLCISSPSTPLLPALGGSPNAGGTWSGPSVLMGGVFNPATMTPGTYSYTVAGTAPCPAASADVLVNVVTTPDAGSPGTITVCASDAAFDLFNELNGTPDPGGAWVGPSIASNGQFDPATMQPGIYAYTISVPPPCVNVSSTVTVNMVQPPDAGNDGSLTLCISSPSTPLLPSIGGSPDAGGSWSGPSVLVGGAFDPATMITGDYTYTVAGTTPCPADAAIVSVTVVAAPDAGTPGSATLCSTDAPISLFEELGGTPDAGGSWSGPSTAIDGAFDPATMLDGVYTYTITVPPPCTNASSNVTITVVQPPDAGSDGGLTLCATSGPEALINGLSGTPDAGGIWSGPSPVNAGNFNPASMNMGNYTYTVAGTTPCPAASAVVEVNVVDNPDPGGPGFITLCSTDDAVDMFTWIEGSPDAGGTWTSPTNATADNLFDPAVDAPGVYTYTLTVPPPCTSASTTVTVDVIEPPQAGDDAAITLCITSGATPLFPVIGGSPDVGGSWTGPGGTPFSGSFDPGMNGGGVFQYTVNGTAPCPADQTLVTVNVVTDPDPGSNGTLTICASDASALLFGSLGGTPDAGGTWTTPAGSAFSGTLDPAVHSSGVYTYTIVAPPPCSNVSSTVTVNIIAPPDAGGDGQLVVCATGEAVDLFNSLQGQPGTNGTWIGPGGSNVSGVFDPTLSDAGIYTYTVAGTSPCPNDAALVTVSITEEPNAGNDAILNLCITGDPVDVFPSLGGADPGGVWTGPGGAAFNGIFTPGTSTPGDHNYQVMGTAPCPNASATVTITQLSDPDAGVDGSTTLCSSNTPIDLFEVLQGTPDPGGTWQTSTGQMVGAFFDPAVQQGDTLSYVLAVPPPCINDTARVVVAVVQASNAGEDASTASCATGDVIDLFAVLNGDPDSDGTWTGPAGAMDGTFAPGTDPAGAYSYVVNGTAPCPNVSATVTVNIESPPDAGTDGGITLCPEAPAIALFSLLGGSPDATGDWTGPGGIASNGQFDPATDSPGTYTYTVQGTLCPNDAATATVTIYLIESPNAGPDAISCNLKYDLAAIGQWASGSWTIPDGFLIDDINSATALVSAPAGGLYTFQWNITTAEGCASSDAISVIFTDPMEGLAATTDAICNGSCDGTAGVSATGGNGSYLYLWSNGIAGNTPQAIGLCAGSYSVIVADSNGCNINLPFTINEPEPFVIDAVVSTPETCPGSCDGAVLVTDGSGALFTLGGITQVHGAFTGLCAGAYPIVVTDAHGCVAEEAAVVTSPPPVLALFSFTPDTVFISEPEVQFLNLSSPNAITFSWSFGELGSSTVEHPSFTFPDGEGGVYDICLTVADANGCSDTLCVPLPVFDILMVHVPNAFSPNGDGINEDFLPVFNLPWVKDYQFMVFNRWGEQIFGTDLPGKPWNGGYGGVVSQEDVYVWKLSCVDALSGEHIERIGHVTLLK